MKLYTNGCSFTWGDGYGDTENIKHLKFLPKYKFSNIIKERLNCKVKNYAIVGNSNENIFRQLYLNEKDFYCWTQGNGWFCDNEKTFKKKK